MVLQTAYTADQFRDICTSHADCPTLTAEQSQRILNLARQMANDRGDYNALEDDETDCLIATGWKNYCEDNFGYSTGDTLNQIALGVYNAGVSARKDAHLFTRTHVLQMDWVQTGDGRKSSVDMYVDDEFDGADPGTLWLPKSITDYFCIIKLDDELLHGSPSAGDAM
jgi:hypothetical protein